MNSPAFWETKNLDELNRSEWEALCDGCGKCCLAKIENEDGSEIAFTRVSCRLLDTNTCQCGDYANRRLQVRDCVQLDVSNIAQIDWLPSTCAYRLRREGKPLFDWHPLNSGSKFSVHEAGMSVQGRVISEKYVHPDGVEEHIVHWVK